MVSVNGVVSSAPRSRDTLLTSAKHLIGVGLDRLQDPEPEGLRTRGLQAIKLIPGLRLLPLLALTNASGLLFVALAYYASVFQYGEIALEIPFIAGLLLMFVPNLLRLLFSKPSRLERICLVCMLSVYFCFVEFMISPHYFSSFDESLHMRTAYDILQSGHLFSLNSMLPVSPYYPGLEIVTDAISTISGLSIFQAGIVLIVAARILLILSLFLFYEEITHSSRMAGLMALIYMTNSHFIFFDTSFSYETLALSLAMFMFYILRRYQSVNQDHRWIIYTAWLVLIALTVTHHMTDYVFDCLLMLWTIVSLFQDSSRRVRIHLGVTTLFAIVLSVAYMYLFKGNPVLSYLSDYFIGAFKDLGQIISGTSTPRPLFANSAGQSAPIWDRLLMTASVGLTTLSLPFGWLSLWRQHRHGTLSVVFSIVSFAYPLVQVFRLTEFGIEIADRSAAFLFLANAFVLTILITHFWPTRTLNRKATSLIACTLSVIFLGSIIVATGPAYSGLAGPYEVVADGRSVEPEGIQAATWMLTYLGPDNRVGTDRINQMLINTYGDQHIVTHLSDGVDISPIFSGSQLGSSENAILQQSKIHYLVVDLRLSTGLPVDGFYFEIDEVDAFQLKQPISRAALMKFSTVPQINRLFDNGNIVIYDTGAISNASQKP
jgi:hypothetical protein